jgi:rubrerythrin
MAKRPLTDRAQRYQRHESALYALEGLWNDPSISHAEAARQVAARYPGEHPGALMRHLQRKRGHIEKTDEHQVLTNVQESIAVGVIRGFSASNRPLTKLQTISMVREIARLPAEWRGDHWYTRFLERHAGALRPHHPKPLALKRTAPELVSEVEYFISSMEEFHKQKSFGAEATFGADETILSIHVGRSGATRLEAVGKINSNFVFPRGTTYGSCIFFSNAAGHTPLVVLVLPFSMLPNPRRKPFVLLPPHVSDPSMHVDVRVAFTATGYMNDQLFEAILEVFLEVLKVRSPGLACQLYLDRLHAHLQPAVAYRARERGLWLNWYSAESSTFLQPADDKQFAALHSSLDQVSSKVDLTNALRSQKPHTLVLSYFWEAVKAAINPNIVKASFRDTGIFPWDPNRIRQNAAKYLAPKKLSQVLAPVSPVAEKATRATLAVLEAHMPARKVRKLSVQPELNRVYRVDELETAEHQKKLHDEAAQQEKLEAKQKRHQQRALARQKKLQEKTERKAVREARKLEQEATKKLQHQQRQIYKCRACGRSCRSRESAPGWLWCEYCVEFAICPYRRLCPDGPELMQEHETKERLAGKRKLPI